MYCLRVVWGWAPGRRSEGAREGVRRGKARARQWFWAGRRRGGIYERETKARDGIDMLVSRPGKAGRELCRAELTSREQLLELHPPARTRTGEKNLFIWASFGKREKGGERVAERPILRLFIGCRASHPPTFSTNDATFLLYFLAWQANLTRRGGLIHSFFYFFYFFRGSFFF